MTGDIGWFHQFLPGAISTLVGVAAGFGLAVSYDVTAAGDTANNKGSFEKRSMDLALSVREVYAVLALLNAVIQGRALYRATSGAMSNYGERRKFLNQQIEGMSETARQSLEALLIELKSLHQSAKAHRRAQQA